MWSYSSEFFWVVLSENTPATKNMFKVNCKKTLELLQLMLFECLSMEYIFQVCDGVHFLLKIQAFPVGLVLYLYVWTYQVYAGLLQGSE